jgi:hypothetical protein
MMRYSGCVKLQANAFMAEFFVLKALDIVLR